MGVTKDKRGGVKEQKRKANSKITQPRLKNRYEREEERERQKEDEL